MARKKNSVSVSAFDDAAKQQRVNVNVIEWNGLSIEVKYTLSLAEAVSFVDAVTNGCFNSETGEYSSIAKPFAMRMAVISFYTNITMPNDYEKRYEMVDEDGLYESVVEAVNHEQFSDLVDVINDRINYLVRAQIATFSKDVNTLLEQFGKLSDSIGSVASSMTEDDMKTMINAFGKMSLNNEQLAEVVASVAALRQKENIEAE